MLRRPSHFSGLAILLVLGWAILTDVPAIAATSDSTDYTWVGSSVANGGDNHSWTDARNWQPTGIPATGDSVSISPVGNHCRAGVDHVPAGLALEALALTGSRDCDLSISGGSLSVLGTFTWETGVLNTPLDLAASASGIVRGGGQGQFDEQLTQPLTVHGSLALDAARLRLANGIELTVEAQGRLSVSAASAMTAASCCADPARLVNHGTLSVGPSALLLTQRVAVEQSALVRVPGSSSILSREAPISAAAGSRYAGSGRWTWSNGSHVVLNGGLLLRGGFHLELGNDGTLGSRLTGFGQFAGHGAFDWTGGTIAAGLMFDTGVMWHVYGEHTGAGQRYLSGLAMNWEGSRQGQTQVSVDGAVVVDHGATITMRHHAIVSFSSRASLTLAPGATVRGRTKSGQPDAIFTSGTPIRVPRVEGQQGPALLDNVELYTEGGTASIDPGAELRLSGSARSTLAFSVYAKGGVFAVAAPVDTITELDFADGTTLALRPGGSLDGATTYAGDGVLDWTGGQISGDPSFDLTGVTVRGSNTKSVSSVGGSASTVQMLSPVTFADGTAAHHNLVDLNGNSMVTFEGARIGHDVELTDGDFANSTSPLTVDPGTDGTAYTDPSLHLFSSGTVSIASGVFAASGPYTDNADTNVAAGATLRLVESGNPLELAGGSLSGAGQVSGVVVNSGGVLEPFSNPDSPLGLTGSYTQTPGGRLLLDLTDVSARLDVQGSFMLQGDVIYANTGGFTPRFGDVRDVVTADVSLDWRPGCEQTTGRVSGRGHWASSVQNSVVRATFVRGSSGTC